MLGQLQPGSGGSGKASEGGDQAVESWGMRERWRVKMGLPEGKAQYQMVLGSSRNSEQRDPKEKGPREAVEGIQTFCKLVTQPDFFLIEE